MKKMMLLALAVAAVFALPASASAGVWHLENIDDTSFSISGTEGSSLSTEGGSTITCTSVGGTGSYSDGTTGSMQLTFHGCKTKVSIFTFNCQSGSTTGTIETTVLPIHNVMIHNDKPGILVTPGENNSFAHFECAGSAVTVEGKGVLGTIISPPCDTNANSAVVDFNATAHGKQEHTQITTTGTVYNLTRGGQPAAQDAKATVTFNEEGFINCT